MSWDPITRIVGNLGIYTKIDFDNREVVSCKSTSSLFRGYSVFMKGKDPRDAHFITSRICGICGDNHAVCSCYAQQMATASTPEPGSGSSTRLAASIFDHIIFQDNCLVDFCEQIVRETKRVGPRREGRARRRVHGYRTIGDMESYNPFRRDVRRLHMAARREMICLMEGAMHPDLPAAWGRSPRRRCSPTTSAASALHGLHQEGRGDER
jgi:hydrogenase large subunit